MCPVILVSDGERRQVAASITRGALAGVTVGGKQMLPGEICFAGDRLNWIADGGAQSATVQVDGCAIYLDRDGVSFVFAEPDPLAARPKPVDPSRIVAPVSGLVRQVSVKAGDKVEAGQLIAVVEAMKMENALYARAAGVVEAVVISAGEQAKAGDQIVVLKVGG